jgi:thioredoxin reductase
MIEADVAIIGAGPAGLSAAIDLAKVGIHPVVIDENDRPGGQLVKQIHKFFGGTEQMAGMRGVEIGQRLFSEAERFGVRFLLNTAAYGIFGNEQIGIYDRGRNRLGLVRTGRIMLATGAKENPLWFPGWTLPGVMGAGAFQTMINVHRVIPGRRILIVGSGNVGLIVAYQALQAGIDVMAVCEALPTVGGWQVHAAKLRRQGVPILLRTTVEQALGNDDVKEVVIVGVRENGEPDPASRRTVDADTVCVAVGLAPLAELAWMAGCQCAYVEELGGWLPVHDEWMQTTIETIWVAGDVAGIEEASVAMEEGRLAALGVARSLGVLEENAVLEEGERVRTRLAELRGGSNGECLRRTKERLMGGENCGCQ